MEKFTIQDFNAKYFHEEVCLHEIFTNRYGDLKKCPSCKEETKFHKVTDRKCYACQWCGYQLHPLAGTIFHKSETPLKSWFFAIFLFANSKNGVSGKELQRQLGVTYKTAWRMAKQIRLLLQHSRGPLSNTVELDETYYGGRTHGKTGRGASGKTPIFGMVERKGDVIAKVVPNAKASSLIPLVEENVKEGSMLMTDEYHAYKRLEWMGYGHKTVHHSAKQYVKKDIYTNTIEGFWSQLKRSIHGTYHSVSPKYLQSYVNEFAWRYNHRYDASPLFYPMISQAGRPV
jgi:transposase